jgi:hypothetical protein
MKDYRHFRGDYRAWFKPSGGQVVHTSSFYNLELDSIEIRNLVPLESRVVDTERVGDYLYFPILRAKKKNAFFRIFQRSATDVVIIANENLAFSEDLEQVILSGHSGSRLQPGSPARKVQFKKISPDFGFLTGTLTFSLKETPIQNPTNKYPESSSPPLEITDVANSEREITEIPDLVLTSGPGPFTSFPQQAGGCFMQLLNLVKWAFYLMLFLAILGWLSHWLKQGGSQDLTDNGDGKIETEKPRLNPKQDTLAPMPWDYLTDHRIRWNDFIEHSFAAQYSTSSKQFENSQGMHAAFANPQVSDAMEYWSAVYNEFSGRDLPKLDSLVQYFQSEQRAKNLNPAQTAEMVITFIQEIPYCLVHDGSCSEANKMADFIRDYHSSGKPCLPEIIAGVQSPYEFLHNLKGDCDTRSLLGFSILSRLGIPASIWVSEAYGHSVMGVGLGSSGGTYNKTVGGLRHSAVELTAKGFRLGMLSPEHGDMNNWKIALYKN